MCEIKNTETVMKNYFDGFMRDWTQERKKISKLQGISIATSQTEKQNKKETVVRSLWLAH